jgi:hypothetical protein
MTAVYQMCSRLLATALGTLCLGSAALAGDDYKISGSAGFRVKSEGQRNGRLNQEAALKIETKRKNGLKAVTKLEADTSDLLVRIDAGYFDLKLSDTTNVRGGLQKKEIGLESSQGAKHRVAPFKSRSLSQLESWGFSGKYNQLKLLRDVGEARVSAGIGSSNSHDSFLSADVTMPVPAAGEWLQAGVWLLGQADRVDNSYQKAGMASVAVWTTTNHLNFELEAAEGTNPHESEYQSTFGNGGAVRFNFGRLLCSLNIDVGDSLLQPFLQYEFLRRDHTDPWNNSLAYTGGLNWLYGHDLRLSVAIQSEGAAAGPDQRRRHWSVQQSIIQAVYYFD